MFEKFAIKVINNFSFQIQVFLLQGEISAASNDPGIVRTLNVKCKVYFLVFFNQSD